MLIEPERAEGCLSDLQLDRHRVGELDARARAAVDEHLVGCAACTARATELREDAERFADEPIPLVLARPRPRPSWVAPSIAAALALAAALAVLWLRPSPVPVELERATRALPVPVPSMLPDGDGTRVKGAPQLGVHVRRDDTVLQLADGDHTRPGDTVRFEVSSSEAKHVAVLSVDGAGTISTYHPAGPQAERVEPGQHVVLDGAIELDDVLGRETIFGVFCTDTVAVEELRAALERDRETPRFSDGCTSSRMVLEKRR